MKSAVALLAMLTTGGVSAALADPLASTPAPAVTAAKPAAAAPGERMQEQLLRSQGYKLTMVNGEERYCRREAPLGSRLATTLNCVTAAQAEAIARQARESTERVQRGWGACLPKAVGGCGN